MGTAESVRWTAFDALGHEVGTGTLSGSGQTVSAFTIDGAVTGGLEFTRVELSGGPASSFRVSINSVVGNTQQVPQTTSLNFTALDADGDALGTVPQSFDLTFDGDRVLTAGTGGTAMAGAMADEVLTGNTGNDELSGGGGNDTLVGAAGRDVLDGGAGDDLLTGGAGADVFRWQLADQGAVGSPARDTITDFEPAAPAAGGDVLDLRDLLVGAAVEPGGGTGNLAEYIRFDTLSVAGSTVIHVSSSGGFADGTPTSAAEDQRITLSGVDLRAALGLGSAASDDQVLQELLNRNKLEVGP
jgi:Ca2+-binding RTX toxin-like protein